MEPIIAAIKEKLLPLANADKAVWMKAYMKNRFEFLGVQMQERRSAFKEYLKDHPIENMATMATIVKKLWLLPEREYQYCAIDLLLVNYTLWDEECIELFVYCVLSKSWWDSVDSIATDCVGKYFKKYPQQMEKITFKWNVSDNMWLQRCSILFQKNYKKDTNVALLSRYIQHLLSSKEFFIQKAIGWMLREYARCNAAWVITFVEENDLQKLSRREALKHLP